MLFTSTHVSKQIVGQSEAANEAKLAGDPCGYWNATTDCGLHTKWV